MAAVRMTDLPTTGTDVLVVGAGPTGLMAGLVLTRRGVPVVVVDQKEGPTRESRALAVQARTMEIYDQLGLAGVDVQFRQDWPEALTECFELLLRVPHLADFEVPVLAEADLVIEPGCG